MSLPFMTTHIFNEIVKAHLLRIASTINTQRLSADMDWQQTAQHIISIETQDSVSVEVIEYSKSKLG